MQLKEDIFCIRYEEDLTRVLDNVTGRILNYALQGNPYYTAAVHHLQHSCTELTSFLGFLFSYGAIVIKMV